MRRPTKTLQRMLPILSFKSFVLIAFTLSIFLIPTLIGKRISVVGQAGPGEPDPTEYAEDTDSCDASPTPTPTPGYCNGIADYTTYPSGCASGFIYTGSTCTRSSAFINKCFELSDYDSDLCICTGSSGDSNSPILIDISGNGFNLTDAQSGVNFDLNSDGKA